MSEILKKKQLQTMSQIDDAAVHVTSSACSDAPKQVGQRQNGKTAIVFDSWK